MKPFVSSETGTLQSVLMGHINEFKIKSPVNSVQHYYFLHDPPRREKMVAQYEAFAAILRDFGVQVHRYDAVPENLDRPFARDALVVIRDHFFICTMKNRSPPDIRELLSQIDVTPELVKNGILEGGDIIQDQGAVYIGLGQRSNHESVSWVKKKLNGQAEVVPVQLKSDVLHLDVVFNPVGRGAALVYPPAIEASSLHLLEQRYRFLPVSAKEQFNLGVNVLSLNPETVVSDIRMERINRLLRKEGCNVIEIDYSEVSKLGGSFRCSTCPLLRELP